MWKLRSERGASLVIAGLFLPLLAGMVGCAIDVGNMYYSQARLQNAADAAALAGIAYNTTASDKHRLVPPPADTQGDSTVGEWYRGEDGLWHNRTVQSFSYEWKDVTYNFEPTESEENRDNLAKAYVTSNVKNNPQNQDYKLWLDRTNYSYGYQVTLADAVPTTFLQVFGVDSLPIQVTALAIEQRSIEHDVEKLVDIIAKVVPNYTWETITHDFSHGNNPSENSKFIGFTTTTKDENGNTISTTPYTYAGRRYIRSYIYFATRSKDYKNVLAFFNAYEPSDYNNLLASYRDTDMTGMDTYKASGLPLNGDVKVALEYLEDNEFNPDPIYANKSDGFKNLIKVVWNFDKKFATTVEKQIETENFDDLQAFFLDRPPQGSNTTVRSTEINITNEQLGKEKDKPLYVRVESEPVLIGASNPTIVQPITINVKYNDHYNKDTKDYETKPIVIAYDGPSMSRTYRDAVYLNTNKVTDFIMAEKMADKVKSGGDWSHYRLTSIVTSPPIVINFDEDSVFYGVIYAPFSRVIINGKGTIKGAIISRGIIGANTHNERKMTLTVPILSTVIQNDKNNREGHWMDYIKRDCTAEFNVYYDEDFNKLDLSFIEW